MYTQTSQLIKRDSLIDLDKFITNTTISTSSHTLKFIDSFLDTNDDSEGSPLLLLPSLDRFSSELEEIAFGNRMIDTPVYLSEKDFTEEDMSTSVHS
jgi:hypothetical protein